jgi:hypothetical protein
MASSRQLISSQTLGSAAASVTFSSIPSTYTDLVLKVSARTDNSGARDYFTVNFNGDSATNYSQTIIYTNNGSGAYSTASSSTTALGAGYAFVDGSGATANTFSNLEMYMPSYATTKTKPSSTFASAENNSASSVWLSSNANLYRSTSAISSMTFTPYTGGNFLAGSTFYLYGISNA